MFDTADYELRWPVAIFVSEAAALLAYTGPAWTDRAGLLVSEAFAGEAPAEDLRAANWADFPAMLADPMSGLTGGADAAQRAFLRKLAAAAPSLSEQSAPRPYWADRQGRQPVPLFPPADRSAQLRRDWVALVEELRGRGYLERIAPKPCAEGPDPPTSELEVLGAATEERLGIAGLWPLRPSNWDDDTFYSLIEVVHDLVARPRSRTWHEWNQCGWHYHAFAVEPGRALYRALVDRLLARHETGLQLAATGEDTGRLINRVDDARAELVERALASPAAASDIAHAIALHRGREAGVPEKRSAILVLSRILESRRVLLSRALFSKDEDALFQIANKFDLRHSDASQKDNYDEAFLDWIFWWYLATVELTDRLLARQGTP